MKGTGGGAGLESCEGREFTLSGGETVPISHAAPMCVPGCAPDHRRSRTERALAPQEPVSTRVSRGHRGCGARRHVQDAQSHILLRGGEAEAGGAVTCPGPGRE